MCDTTLIQGATAIRDLRVGVEQDNWYISVRQLPPSCPPTTIRLLLSFIVSKEVPDKARGNEGPGTREISRPEKVCLSHIKVSGVSLSLSKPLVNY